MKPQQFSSFVKLGVVRLSFLDNLVNGSKQHTSNGNNSPFVTTAFFNREEAKFNFRVLVRLDNSVGNLNK